MASSVLPDPRIPDPEAAAIPSTLQDYYEAMRKNVQLPLHETFVIRDPNEPFPEAGWVWDTLDSLRACNEAPSASVFRQHS